MLIVMTFLGLLRQHSAFLDERNAMSRECLVGYSWIVQKFKSERET